MSRENTARTPASRLLNKVALEICAARTNSINDLASLMADLYEAEVAKARKILKTIIDNFDNPDDESRTDEGLRQINLAEFEKVEELRAKIEEQKKVVEKYRIQHEASKNWLL